MVEDVDIDALDVADEADLRRLGRRLDVKERAVLPGKADRGLSMPVEALDDVRVDLAEQHHLRHLDRLAVGDAQTLDELDLHPEPLHVTGDLGAATVHDHRVQADVLEQHDVGRKLVAERFVLHRRAAVLDHDRAAVELLDVRERLEQRAEAAGEGACPAFRVNLFAHVVYSALILMYSWVRSLK